MRATAPYSEFGDNLTVEGLLDAYRRFLAVTELESQKAKDVRAILTSADEVEFRVSRYLEPDQMVVAAVPSLGEFGGPKRAMMVCGTSAERAGRDLLAVFGIWPTNGFPGGVSVTASVTNESVSGE